MNLKKQLKWQIRKFLIDHYPKMIIDHEWPAQFGHKVNWESPRDANEKMQWLICYSDTSEWTRLADKYRVREFVKERGFEHLLLPLYGAWEKAEDIDFDALPDKFVLKCNHDSASTKIIDKKKGYDKAQLVSFYNQRLKQKYGYLNCEPHYNKIPPLVIAEQFLEQENNEFHSVSDYKFWCFDGRVYYVSVMFDRTQENVNETVYDLDWNPHPEFLESYGHYTSDGRVLPKPQNFDEMLEIVKILSKGFPMVRVDLYEVNGKIYFGEMTFTSTAGRMGYVDSFLKELGGYVILPEKRCPIK